MVCQCSSCSYSRPVPIMQQNKSMNSCIRPVSIQRYYKVVFHCSPYFIEMSSVRWQDWF